MSYSPEARIGSDESRARTVGDESWSHINAAVSQQDVRGSHQDWPLPHQDTPSPQIYTFPRMVRYVRILDQLDRFERRLLLRMLKQLGTLLIAQRTVSMPELMARFDTEPAPEEAPRLTPGRLVYLVTGLVRFTLRDRFCMKRSILIFHYLRKWGYSVRIVFGVVKEADGLQGHAWVELNGRPLAERGDPRMRYAVTYAYPREEAITR